MTKLKYIAFLAMMILIACSKVTQANFDKVKPTMSMKEVVSILGKPTDSQSVNIAGISGTSATWKDDHAEISIQFLNDQVAVKIFNNLDDKKGKK